MKYILLFIPFVSFCWGIEPYQSILQQAIEKYDIPGLAVAIYVNDTPKILSFGLANKNSGKKVDQNTIFDIASLTKLFTATAIALEVQKGNMRLTDAVTVYLPKKKSFTDINQVTIQSLLTQSSSLPKSPPILSLREKHSFESIFHYLLTWKAPYPSGTRYLYSNLGFGILGFALANAEKKPYRVSIKVLITRPLKMNATVFQVPPTLQKNYAQGYLPDNSLVRRREVSAMPASGALKSSSSDMLKFLMANLGVYGPKNLQEAMQLTHREFFVVNPEFSMGLGWQRIQGDHMLLVDKNGGLPGFSSYMGLIPYKKIGIVLLANKSKVPLTQIGREILKQLAK